MSIDTSQFIPTFLEESFEGLDLMESSLLALDAGDIDTINAIFRAAHSIKGGAGTFGFQGITEFTHGMETLLDELRNEKRSVDQATTDLLLEAVDVLRDLLGKARDGAALESDGAEDVAARIQGVLGAAPAAAATPAATAAAEQDTAGPATHDSGQPRPESWKIIFTPHASLLASGNDPARMFAILEDLGELTVSADSSCLPSLEELDPEQCKVGWTLRLKGEVEQEQIAEVFEWVEGDCDLIIIPVMPTGYVPPTPGREAKVEVVPTPAARPVATKSKAKSTAKAPRGPESTSIRVAIDKVDALINNVGELVIIQSMLSQQGQNLDEFTAERLEILRTGLEQLERHTRELQENVMRIRMLPISFAFNRFPRLVHDLSTKLGKKVELRLSGEQTELDKTVMEKIGDPLVHCVRNSLDHGLEMPEERLAAGKSETGIVDLKAYHQGGNIIIEIIDDGRGLDPVKIGEKALEKGVISDPDELTETELQNLVFEPGFSTASVVSDVSGRGVGMDVVRRNVRDLGGSVEVVSQVGQGATFTIRLPLTLAILDGQLVKVHGQTYVVPLIAIIESLSIDLKQVSAVGGQAEMHKLRDEYIPMLRLGELFGYERGERGSLQGKLLVVVEGEGSHVGIVVDELEGQQQVVVKSLETNFHPLEGISGATILGDGTVALILDVAGIVALHQIGRRGVASSAAMAEEVQA